MTVDEIFNSDPAQYFRDCLWNKENEKIPVCNTCQCYDCRTSNVDELDRIVAWEGSQLRGKEVFFWGCGQTYRRFSYFFEGCKPIAMIVDEDEKQEMIDGIPVASPDILLKPEYKKIPVVVFAWAESSSKILLKIKEKYGRSLKDIWCVPPNY